MLQDKDTQYRFIYRDIVTEIYIGKREKGEFLPSQDALTEIYGVGRNTVRTALQLLEENGYIRRSGRKLAVICFDWEDAGLREKYLKELKQREQAVKDVCDFLIIAMPEMFTRIVMAASSEERHMLEDMVGRCLDDLPEYTERAVSTKLMEVYRAALSLLGNDLIQDLFASLFNMIQLPVEKSHYGDIKFRAAMLLSRKIVKRFQRLLQEENYTALKKQILFFCKSTRQNTDDYFKEHTENLHVEKELPYNWLPGHEQGKGYLFLAVDIFWKIRNGIYAVDTILPSYDRLAEQNGVSAKTSRKAIELLNTWGVVNTINGVGSHVNALSEEQRAALLKEDVFREGIESCFQALQIYLLICRPIVQYTVMNVPEWQLLEFVKRAKEDPFVGYMTIDFLFKQGGPVTANIYEQLRCRMQWGSILLPDDDMHEKGQAEQLLSLLQNRNDEELAELVYKGAVDYFTEIKRIWTDMGNPVELKIL